MQNRQCDIQKFNIVKNIKKISCCKISFVKTDPGRHIYHTKFLVKIQQKYSNVKSPLSKNVDPREGQDVFLHIGLADF